MSGTFWVIYRMRQVIGSILHAQTLTKFNHGIGMARVGFNIIIMNSLLFFSPGI